MSLGGFGSVGESAAIPIHVAPVQATNAQSTGTGGGANPGFLSVGDPLLAEILRGAKRPIFTGKQVDWAEFVADWEFFLESDFRVEGGERLLETDGF